MTASTDYAESIETLTYRCPHCGAPNKVEPAAIGENFRCLNDKCSRLFRVDAPSGTLMEDYDGERLSVDDTERSPVVPTEQNLIERHPAMFANHPLYFLGLSLLAVAGAAGVIFSFTPGVGPLFLAAGSIALLAGLGAFGVWYLQTIFQTVVVTSKRTIYRRGVLSKESSEVQHDDVRNMQVHQDFFDRIMNVGRVAISSSGQDDMEIDVAGIKNPNEIVSVVRRYQ